MKSFETVCVDIRISPPLGGALITITEGIVENRNISLCMYSNSLIENYVKKVDAILRMALNIEGVVGASYSEKDNVKIAYGKICSHAHTNNNRVIDSPARLMQIAPTKGIINVLRFKSEIYLSATRKLGVKEGADFLVLHANLTKRLQFFSRKSKKLSIGTEWSWAKAAKRFVARKTCMPVVLIGNDSKYFRKFTSRHIYNAQRLGLDLSEQLSLVSKSRGFVGMSAGPSVVALLGSVPFCIFKESNHHKTQMDQEIGRENRYSFSLLSQSYIREYPSTKHIYNSMVSIVSEGNSWHM